MTQNTDYKPSELDFGWGEETLSHQQIVSQEKAGREQLESVAPMLCTARGERTMNDELLAKIKALMANDGMTGGLDVTYIQPIVFGGFLQWLKQLIGSCVGSGSMRMITNRTIWEVFVFNDPETILGTDLVTRDNVAPFAPYHYGWGRSEGNIHNGDGSYCSAQIKAFMRRGLLPCSTPGLTSDAFPEPQSMSLYRQWGDSSSLLNQFLAEGQKRKLIESVTVNDVSTLKENVLQAKPSMICSNWAFKPSYQHPTWKLANGNPVWIYTRDRSTSWGHNLSLPAVVEAETKEWSKVENSWGMNAHKNGDYFIISADEQNEWLKSAEAATIGEIDLADNAPVVNW